MWLEFSTKIKGIGGAENAPRLNILRNYQQGMENTGLVRTDHGLK
tara:strand:+ start:162 stop:296 length:135 start_codon:yes stop_codon:yes gene_type:complete